MGIYTDLATGSNTIAPAVPRSGLDRSSAEQLLSKAVRHDPLIGSAYAARDDVQVIPEQTDAAAADTYTLTIALLGSVDVSFTTADIAYDAVDTVIETAIDVAATAATFPTWTNADISVSMGGSAGVDDGTVTLTFDGASVTETAVALVILTATGFTKTDPIARTTTGQADRKAAQALFELNAVSGTLTASGVAPTDWVRPATGGQSRPRKGLLRDLAVQSIIEEGDDLVYDAVVAIYPEVAKS